MKVYKFNNCYLDTIERRVFKNGQSIEITPRAFDILQLLVESHGKLVTKADLIQKVWHDSFIEEGNIPVHISKLRKMLGANRAEPLIETVSGVGYQFVSRVSLVSERDFERYLGKNEKEPQAKISDAPNLDSLAVLPFQNAGSHKEAEYLAEGLTESIINNLSYVPEIRVLARNTVFRFQDSALEAQQIGTALGVAGVVTGRVKIINENIVIGVELMKVSDGTQLWGKQFNQPFSDIFEIQEKIAYEISEKLRVKISDLAKNSIQVQSSQNLKAYTQYLKGRHFWAKRGFIDLHQAIKHFQESISEDPTYIPSYIGLVDCYLNLFGLQHLSRSEALLFVNPILNQVSEYDEKSPETLELIGYVKMLFDLDLQLAEACFTKSLALNPNNTIALYRYANLLAIKGRFSESLKQLQKALLLDPLSIIINTTLGKVFLFMEQYDNAVIRLRETLELDPDNYLTLLLLAITLAIQGKREEALSLIPSDLITPENIEVLSIIGYVSALAGNKDKARQIIKQIEQQTNKKDIDATNLAYIYIALGEMSKALEYLEKAFTQFSVDLLAIKVDPRLKPIRQHPQFLDLLRRIGLLRT